MIGLFCLLLTASAVAKSYPERMNLYVPVPRSELEIEVPDEENKEPSTFEVAYSSWEPNDLRRKDYRGVNGKFDTSFPLLSLNYSSSLLSFGRGANLRAKFGISTSSLERKGLAFGRIAEVEQTMNLYMARLGLEYDGPIFTFIQPYIALSVLPTLGLASQSELEDSVSAFGLPLEAGAGLMFNTGWMLWGFNQLTFGAGGQYISGSLDSSDLAGFGFQAFVRVGL